MSSEVKRYDPINSDGTCGMCIEDADYGAYVEYADYAALEAELATVKKVAYGNMELLDENRNLQAELAKLRAGQEPVAFKKPSVLKECNVRYSTSTTPQPSAVPAGWKLVPVEPTPEMVSAAEEAHMPFGDMDIALRMAILAAPSAPATVPSVNQQLLEALEGLVNVNEQHNSAIQRVTGTPAGWKDDYLNLARAAIAAARKGEGE